MLISLIVSGFQAIVLGLPISFFVINEFHNTGLVPHLLLNRS